MSLSASIWVFPYCKLDVSHVSYLLNCWALVFSPVTLFFSWTVQLFKIHKQVSWKQQIIELAKGKVFETCITVLTFLHFPSLVSAHLRTHSVKAFRLLIVIVISRWLVYARCHDSINKCLFHKKVVWTTQRPLRLMNQGRCVQHYKWNVSQDCVVYYYGVIYIWAFRNVT